MILTIDHGPVREVRLNRPPANALSPELMVALRQAVAAAPREGVRALVLSGAPGMFSAGLDVPLLLTLDRAAMAAAWRELYAVMGGLAESRIPIAAAITGHAPAGGTVLALFCDWRVIAEGNWRVGLNEVQVGLPLPPVIFSALKRLVGPRQAERLAAGGVLVPPAEAQHFGLVDEVVPPERVVERAVEWCREMLALPPVAMSITRQKARADLVSLFSGNLESELNDAIASWWSDEAQTVLRGLADKLGKKK